MKKILFTFLLAFLLKGAFIQAQISFECKMDNYAEFDDRLQSCGNLSPQYLQKYRNYQYYIDNYLKRPVVTIKVAFHIYQKSDGSENWQNTLADIALLKQHIDIVNAIYANNTSPSDPIVGISELPSMKIQFEVAQIYFYQDDILWNKSGTLGIIDLIDFVNTNFPERLNYLNVHITGANVPYGLQYFTNVLTHYNDPVLSFAWSNHLAHEIGHTLNLYHTYDGSNDGLYNGAPGDVCCPEENTISEPDFLDDVFDISQPNWCGALSGDICYHNLNWNADADDNINFPYITRNLMGGNNTNNYYSPKQVAKTHRALAFSGIRKWVKCEEYFVDPIEITSNETWDFDIKLYNPIVVKSGVTLTIQCKVAFAKNHKIIVEPGGKLVLDGGILTSHCESWEGIEVQGNSNLSQNAANQGWVELKNDAVIENAVIGIRTIAMNGNTPDYTKTGGIIKATNLTGTNCTFKNCHTGINVLSYHSYNFNGIEVKNVSRIYNCKFITDDNFPLLSPYQYPFSGIDIYDVNGVNIVNCLFENQRTDLNNLPVNERGSGIISLDAAFNVAPRYNLSTGVKISGTENQFKNLFHGVLIGSGVQAMTSNVKDNIFENNGYGVTLDVGIYNLIARNNFSIPGADLSVPTYNYSFGIYSEYGTHFNVEENTFTNATGNLLPNQAMISNHSFGPVAKFYRNTVNGTSFGVQTKGSVNLEFKIDCNSFNKTTHSTIDIHHSEGQLAPQGTQSSPAKNLFTGICNNGAIAQVYKNPSALPFYYTYFNPSLNLTCQNLGPYLLSGTGNNFCTNTIPNFSLISFPQKLSQLKSSILEINQTIADKKSLIDGNNTSGILALIATSTDPEIVKDALLLASPYLSDEVLIAYFTSNPPSGHLKQVALANSPLSEKAWSKLDQVNLSVGIKGQITDAQTGVSERTKLETEIEVLGTDKKLELNDLVRIYLDTNWVDSAVVYLKQEGSIDALCALVPIQIKRDTTDSKIQMDQLIYEASCLEQADPNCLKAAELRTFCELHSSLIKILQRPGKYFSITSSERQFLETVALETNSPGAHARAILKYIDKNYMPLEGEYAYFLQSMMEDISSIEQDEKYEFEVSPNPTNGKIRIKINPDELENSTVIITDINGKIVKMIPIQNESETTDMSGLSEGIYMVYLISSEKIIAHKKIQYTR